MWLGASDPPLALVVLALALASTSSSRLISGGATNDGDGVTREIYRAQHHGKKERISVPLGRRLADVLSISNDDGQVSNSGAASQGRRRRGRRRFEIEADDDTPTGARLLVEEVPQMAVTPQTTYRFHKDRDFEHRKVRDIAILASDPSEHEGMTIMSVNKSSGDVRGIRRGGTGHAHSISHDETSNRVRMRRALRLSGDDERMKNWSCDTAHAHDDDNLRSREHHDRLHSDDDMSMPSFDLGDFSRRSFPDTFSAFDGENGKPADSGRSHPTEAELTAGTEGTWVEPKKYSFHVDLAVDIDGNFIDKQGGPEAAVEYVNFLVSAANTLLEHEVDAHLNIVHIEEQTFYDTLITTNEALRAQRLHPRPHIDKSSSNIILHHAILGRYVGGGIAFIDTVCDDAWGYGVTSDVSGKLSDIDEMVLFDFFIVTHELGHSLGSGHTFDGYDPPVDVCGLACTNKQQNVGVEGLPRENAATIMSYCNFCEGGLDNIAITLGGLWDGQEPRSSIDHWQNHPDIVGSVSTEPRRVSHNVWQKLSNKGKCVEPPVEPLVSRGCNGDDDCDDRNSCTIDVCNESDLCAVSETLDNCCGNGICEAGESPSCPDCGPFSVRAPSFCEECHALGGFMVDVGLGKSAETRIFVSLIKVAYATPSTGQGATIDVYVTTEGSYIGKEQSPMDWEKLTTVRVDKYNPRKTKGIVGIKLSHTVPLDIGSRRGFYLVASEDILQFGEGVYSVRNDQEVELHSSRAVSGPFGAGIDGFSLSCEVNYVLDDTSPQSRPKPEGSDRVPGASASPSSSRPLSSSHAVFDVPLETLPSRSSADVDEHDVDDEHDGDTGNDPKENIAPPLPSSGIPPDETQIDSRAAVDMRTVLIATTVAGVAALAMLTAFAIRSRRRRDETALVTTKPLGETSMTHRQYLDDLDEEEAGYENATKAVVSPIADLNSCADTVIHKISISNSGEEYEIEAKVAKQG